MSPQQQIDELKKQVEELQLFVRTLTSGNMVRPDVRKAITSTLTSNSTKTAASGTQAVNESGTSSYSVMTAPSGFISIGGYNVPYIN